MYAVAITILWLCGDKRREKKNFTTNMDDIFFLVCIHIQNIAPTLVNNCQLLVFYIQFHSLSWCIHTSETVWLVFFSFERLANVKWVRICVFSTNSVSTLFASFNFHLSEKLFNFYLSIDFYRLIKVFSLLKGPDYSKYILGEWLDFWILSIFWQQMAFYAMNYSINF